MVKKVVIFETFIYQFYRRTLNLLQKQITQSEKKSIKKVNLKIIQNFFLLSLTGCLNSLPQSVTFYTKAIHLQTHRQNLIKIRLKWKI